MQYRDMTGAVLLLTVSAAGCGAETSRARQQQATPSEPRWDMSAAEQLRDAIAHRARHGLDHMTFPDGGEPGSNQGDHALTQSALRYARALAAGAASPEKLFDIYTIPRPHPDLMQGLSRALSDGSIRSWVESLAPQDSAYQGLSKAYLALRADKSPPSPHIPLKSGLIEPGDADPRIPAVIRQLTLSGYLTAAAGRDDRYTPPMVRAVRHMQADYGIRTDGIIGRDTLEALNLSDEGRARAIAVAMERLRWLERHPPETRIDVNTASGQLTYWRDGQLADRRKVITGMPGKETPQLGSPIYRLVANPTWTVPRSIQREEMAGKGSAYLRRRDMVWKDGWIVQQSGPQNALGLVKFDMKNDFAIYLHDTPAKRLFDQVQRQRSHGCVRVEDAVGFAAMLARDQGVLQAWTKARAAGNETFVPLPQEIPVRLLYQTTQIDADGEPAVRADPYGWDDRVARALGFGPGVRPHLRRQEGDIGP